MVAFMVFATGAAVAMALFHLVRAVIGFTPGFNRETLDEIGMAAAFAVFCGAGPVLLVRALETAEPVNVAQSLRNTLVFTFLILVWTGALGVLAVESARAVL